MPKLRAYLKARYRALALPRKYLPMAQNAIDALRDYELSHHTERPSCFGKAWAVGHSPACEPCPVQVTCLQICAQRRLLDLKEAHPRATLAQLADVVSLPVPCVAMWNDADKAMCRHTGRQVASQPETQMLELQTDREKRLWRARHARERERMPQLKRLPIDTLLRRPFCRRTYQVFIRDGAYELEKTLYPTLYAVAMAITGSQAYPSRPQETKAEVSRLCGNWSAARFFRASIEEAINYHAFKDVPPV